MKNILITRSKNKSKKLGEIIEKAGSKVFFQALFSIKKISLTNNFNFPQLAPIIISSANAIHILQKYNLDKNTPIYCVGKITAQKIQKLGYHQIILSKKNRARNLFEIIIQNLNPQKIYYFHGEKISFDFKRALYKQGFDVENYIVYKTCEIKNFGTKFIDFVRINKFDEVLIFSKNSLEIFHKKCLEHNLIEYFNSSNIICMSSNIARNAQKIGFKKVSTFQKYPLLNKFYDTR